MGLLLRPHHGLKGLVVRSQLLESGANLINGGALAKGHGGGAEVHQRDDLGLEGDAIRRISYAAGKPRQREYFNRDGVCLSRESFDAGGFISERVVFAVDGRETDHWRFERGEPVRQVRKGREYVKLGERFGFYQDGKFVDAPRGALSQ